MYKPDTLSIVTTYKCTAACEHCCFRCSPQRTETLSLERIKKYIKDATEVPSIKLIVFTGGECFTLGDDLFAAIRYAHEFGFATRCVSNGYWATTERNAKKIFEKIKKAGLTEINFSTGDYHSAHIAIDTVIRGIKTTCENGMVTAVNIELFENSQTKSIFKSIFKVWKNKYPHLHVNHGLWIPNGGSTKLRHSEFFQNNGIKCNRGCNSILNSISVSPNGKVLACCGLYSNYMPDLVLGGLDNENLVNILKKTLYKEDLLKIALAVSGPEYILTHAQKYNSRISVKKRYVHPCQSCLQIYHNKEIRPAIVKTCQEKAEQFYATYRIANAMDDCIMGRDLIRPDF